MHTEHSDEVATARRILVWKYFVPEFLRFPLMLLIIVIYMLSGGVYMSAVRLLEQPAAAHYTQPRFRSLLPVPVYGYSRQCAAYRHSDRIQHFGLRLEGDAPSHDRGIHRCIRAGIFLHEARIPAGSLHPVQGDRLSRRHPVEPVAALHHLHLCLRLSLIHI